MNFELKLRCDVKSPRARSRIVVAILAVLHWSAPGALSLQDVVAIDSPGSFYSTAQVSQPGSLPRAAARLVGLDTNKPKSEQNRPVDDGKYAVLSAIDRAVVRLAGTASAPRVESPALRTARSRGFDARAPPRATT